MRRGSHRSNLSSSTVTHSAARHVRHVEALFRGPGQGFTQGAHRLGPNLSHRVVHVEEKPLSAEAPLNNRALARLTTLLKRSPYHGPRNPLPMVAHVLAGRQCPIGQDARETPLLHQGWYGGCRTPGARWLVTECKCSSLSRSCSHHSVI